MSLDEDSAISTPPARRSSPWRRRGAVAVSVAEALLSDDTDETDDSLAAKGAELLFGEDDREDAVAESVVEDEVAAEDAAFFVEADDGVSDDDTSDDDVSHDELDATPAGPTARQLRKERKREERQERKERRKVEAAERAAAVTARQEQEQAEREAAALLEQEAAETITADDVIEVEAASTDETALPAETVVPDEVTGARRTRSRRERRRTEAELTTDPAESAVKAVEAVEVVDDVTVDQNEVEVSAESDADDVSTEPGRRARRKAKAERKADRAESKVTSTDDLTQDDSEEPDHLSAEPSRSDNLAVEAGADQADAAVSSNEPSADDASTDSRRRSRRKAKAERKADRAESKVTSTDDLTQDDSEEPDHLSAEASRSDDSAAEADADQADAAVSSNEPSADDASTESRRRSRRKVKADRNADAVIDDTASTQEVEQHDVEQHDVELEDSGENDRGALEEGASYESTDDDSTEPGRRARRQARADAKADRKASRETERSDSNETRVEQDRAIDDRTDHVELISEDASVTDDSSRRQRRKTAKSARTLPVETGVALSGQRPKGRKARKQLAHTDSSLVGQAIALALAVPENVKSIDHPKLYQTELLLDTALRARARELAALYPGEPLDEITAASVIGSLLRTDVAGDVAALAVPGRSKGKGILAVVVVGAAGAAGYAVWKKRAEDSGPSEQLSSYEASYNPDATPAPPTPDSAVGDQIAGHTPPPPPPTY